MAKSIDDVKKRIDAIRAQADGELSAIPGQRQAAQARQDEAAVRMSAAVQARNEAAYRQAKNEWQGEADILEMLDIRQKELSERPLVTTEEYEDLCGAVKADFNQRKAKAGRELARLQGEMLAVGDGLAKNMQEANSILKEIQDGLYRSADRMRDKRGQVIVIDSQSQKVDAVGEVHWARHAAELPVCKGYMEEA